MKKTVLVVLILAGLLSGCGKPKTDLTKLTCNDDPAGPTKEEQMAIADACFRGGSFKKSSGIQW